MSKERHVYRCQNRDCGCEFVVTKTSVETKKANPRCFCGTEMKKPYSPPALRTREPGDELVGRLKANRKLTS